MFVIRTLLFASGLYFFWHQYGFRSTTDKNVIEPLVTLVYDGIAVFLTLWALFVPYFPVSGLPGLLFSIIGIFSFLFSGFIIGLALFTAIYPYLVPSKSADGNERIMIVLGAPVWQDAPTSPLLSRSSAAAEWIRCHPDGVAILSGGKQNYMTEAQMLMNLLAKQNATAAQILLEEKSLTTDENFIYSRQLLESIGISADSSIVITTSNFHFFRLRYYANRNGFHNIRFLPAQMPFHTAWMWYIREAIVTVRFWLLKK